MSTTKIARRAESALWRVSDAWHEAMHELHAVESEEERELVRERCRALVQPTREGVEEVAEALRMIDDQRRVLRAEEVRLAEMRGRLTRLREDVRASLSSVLRQHGLERVDGDTHSVSVTAPGKKLVIDDQSALPREYVEIQHVPMRARIRERLLRGEDVPGAHLEEGEPGVRVT